MSSEAPRVLVEACVDSVANAVAAEAAGANRIELCGPGNGGTTPSFGMMARCRDMVRVPIHVMLRPREGDFVYSEDELQIMLRDIGAARSAGVDGVVCGILHRDGTINTDQMAAIVEAARPLRVVCHRAFDHTGDANSALEALMGLGVNEVLTSGHGKTAVDGMSQLAEHCRQANNRIGIMAGGGVRAENVREIAAFTKVPAVHVRATDTAVFAAVVERLGRRIHA